MTARLRDICIDAGDVTLVATFWAALLGYRTDLREDGTARLTGGGPTVWVNPVPEPRTAKTRVHLDLTLDAADPREVLALGGTLLSGPDGAGTTWWVLADPEGTEFCAFPPEHPQAGDNDADAEA